MSQRNDRRPKTLKTDPASIAPISAFSPAREAASGWVRAVAINASG